MNMKSYEKMTKPELIDALKSLEPKQTSADWTTPKKEKKVPSRTHDALEVRVQERTAGLQTINEALRKQITVHRLAEEKFREMIESAPDAIVMVDNQGHILHVNGETAKMFGYQPKEILHQPVEILLPPRFRTAHVGHRDAYYKHPQTRPMGVGPDLFGLRMDGSEFPIEIRLSPVKTDEGVLVISVIRDITERKGVEDALRGQKQLLEEKVREMDIRVQSERLAGIGIMAAGIAHEVNNPLAVMLGKAEMILEEEDPTRIKKYAQDIIKFAKKASDVVKRITLYSRAASAPGTGGRIHLNDQLNEAIKLSKYANPFDHVELITDFQSVPPVRSNSGEIQQVFVNLINNAVQAMNGKGRLFVTSRYEDGSVVVTVRDTGAGIKKEHLTKLFTPFFTTKDPGKGTGLGLSIVHKIISEHGGSISVESEEGQGAAFIVRLPPAYESSKGEEEKDDIEVKKAV